MKRLAQQQMYAYRHSINVVDLLNTVTAEGRGDYTHIDG